MKKIKFNIKDPKIIVGAIVILGILVVLALYHPQKPQEQVINKDTRRESAPPIQSMGAAAIVKVDKVEGQKIYFTWNEEVKWVLVTPQTKILKQVETKGKFSDVTITVADIKPGNFIEIKFNKSPEKADVIRLLQ